eukprot:6153105-Pyramimonas_sp.AAC.1
MRALLPGGYGCHILALAMRGLSMLPPDVVLILEFPANGRGLVGEVREYWWQLSEGDQLSTDAKADFVWDLPVRILIQATRWHSVHVADAERAFISAPDKRG